MNDMTAPPRSADVRASVAAAETLDYCHAHDMFACAWCEPSAGFWSAAWNAAYPVLPARFTQLSYFGRCSRFWREFPPTTRRVMPA